MFLKSSHKHVIFPQMFVEILSNMCKIYLDRFQNCKMERRLGSTNNPKHATIIVFYTIWVFQRDMNAAR